MTPLSHTYIDHLLQSLTQHSPGNMARIIHSMTPVTQANCVDTSARFQSYAQKLQSMIPTTITTTQPPPNAWKRRSPVTMDLMADQFPTLKASKKLRVDPHTVNDNTSATKSTESLILVDLDEIERAQQQIKLELQQKIAQMRQSTEAMQQQLQSNFNTAMQQLELRITQTTTQMIQNLMCRSNRLLKP